MKFRKTRQVFHGASNFNNYNQKKPVQSLTNRITRASTQQKITKQMQQEHNTKFISSIKISSNQPLFNNLFPQPQINPNNNCFKQVTKVEQIANVLKNTCQYKKYQYYNVFKYFDQNNNGKITQKNFTNAIKAYGFNINQAEAQEIVHMFKNQSKQTKKYHRFIQKKSNTEQQYFTLQNFVNFVGNYSQNDRKITGDPLQTKLSKNKQTKQRRMSRHRNSSLNLKSLLISELIEQPKSEITQIQNMQPQRKRPQTGIQKKRVSRFIPQVEQVSHNIKRACSANPLIARSFLSSSQLTFMKCNPTNETNDKVEKSIPFQLYSVEKDSKVMLIKDQQQEKMVKRGRYQAKLRKICQNYQTTTNIATNLNHLNQNKIKFTQSYGLLSQPKFTRT